MPKLKTNTGSKKRFTLTGSGKIKRKQLEEMPSKISASVDDSVNLKIENATQKLTISFYKWLVPIILGLLFSFAGTIFNFIK